MYKLLLDDIRNPPRQPDGNVESGWRIARNVNQAINIVLVRGLPYHIAWDHDLGENEENGMYFAKWIVYYCQVNKLAPDFTYHIHSMNPVGAENIRSYIENFKRVSK